MRIRFASACAGAAIGGLVASTLLAATARWWWLGEVACSFRWQLGCTCAVIALALACIAFLKRSRATRAPRWLAVASALLALYHLVPQLVLWWPPSREQRAGRELTIATANVFIGSTDTTGFVEWARATQPDVLGVTEVNSTWRAVCEDLADLYPVRLYHPQDPRVVTTGTYGTALLSRLPLLRAKVHEHGNLGGFVEAELAIGAERELAHDVAGERARDADGAPARDANGEPARDANGEPAREADGESARDANGEPAREADGESAREADGELERDANDAPGRGADREFRRGADGELERNANGELERNAEGGRARNVESGRARNVESGRARNVESGRARNAGHLPRDGRPLHVVMIHPNRPGRGDKWERREALLEHVLDDVVYRESSVLMGDFNTTSYSPRFDALLGRTSLRDSRAGFGRQPTFDTKRLIPGLSVDIDHVLVGTGIDVLERRTLAVRGSDHRYVEARLRVAR